MTYSGKYLNSIMHTKQLSNDIPKKKHFLSYSLLLFRFYLFIYFFIPFVIWFTPPPPLLSPAWEKKLAVFLVELRFAETVQKMDMFYSLISFKSVLRKEVSTEVITCLYKAIIHNFMQFLSVKSCMEL